MTDTIMVLTETNVIFLASKKKIEFIAKVSVKDKYLILNIYINPAFTYVEINQLLHTRIEVLNIESLRD